MHENTRNALAESREPDVSQSGSRRSEEDDVALDQGGQLLVRQVQKIPCRKIERRVIARIIDQQMAICRDRNLELSDLEFSHGECSCTELAACFRSLENKGFVAKCDTKRFKCKGRIYFTVRAGDEHWNLAHHPVGIRLPKGNGTTSLRDSLIGRQAHHAASDRVEERCRIFPEDDVGSLGIGQSHCRSRFVEKPEDRWQPGH